MTDDLTEIDGVGPAIAEQLRGAGYETTDDVMAADVDDLADVHMLGESSAKAILEDDEEGQGKGRPAGFTDDLARRAIEAARKGKSESGIEREVGVGDRTIFGDGGWLDQDLTYVTDDGQRRDFSRVLRRARGDGEDQWIEEGRSEDGDSSFAKFMLSTSYDYVKTEKREIDADVDADVDTTYDVTAEFVTYSAEDDDTDGDE